MSFVVSESKRELDFFMNKRSSVGPNIGPGAYIATQQLNNSYESKIPFGSG
jgi:hypothetical protein